MEVEIRQIYTEALKRQVIEEYLRGHVSKTELQRRHGIKFKSAIATWMKQLGYSDIDRGNSILSLVKRIEVAKKSNPPTSSGDLEAKIKLLEKQLEDERLRSQMYNRMIEVAEKEYKIAIRKNSNTK